MTKIKLHIAPHGGVPAAVPTESTEAIGDGESSGTVLKLRPGRPVKDLPTPPDTAMPPQQEGEEDPVQKANIPRLPSLTISVNAHGYAKGAITPEDPETAEERPISLHLSTKRSSAQPSADAKRQKRQHTPQTAKDAGEAGVLPKKPKLILHGHLPPATEDAAPPSAKVKPVKLDLRLSKKDHPFSDSGTHYCSRESWR